VGSRHPSSPWHCSRLPIASRRRSWRSSPACSRNGRTRAAASIRTFAQQPSPRPLSGSPRLICTWSCQRCSTRLRRPGPPTL
jgi:hypothetical protein